MKTSRYVLIAAVGLLVGLSNTALARPKVDVDINIGGRPNFHGRGRGDFRFDRRPRHFEPACGRWNYRPHRSTIIIGGCWYDRGPDYYVVAPPVIVERPPVVIERPIVVVQPQQFDDSTLQRNIELQY
ncbi:MAG: hypothetical protein WC454_10325, partial [Phycisphaerae bacterium]